MPAFRRRESSNSSLSTDIKSDNRTSSVREPDPWLGATANQALFFAMLMKLVFSFYDFKQLIETATVTMKDGTIAVHSPEHALEHAKGEKIGSARISPTFADAKISHRDCSTPTHRPRRPCRMVGTRLRHRQHHSNHDVFIQDAHADGVGARRTRQQVQNRARDH